MYPRQGISKAKKTGPAALPSAAASSWKRRSSSWMSSRRWAPVPSGSTFRRQLGPTQLLSAEAQRRGKAATVRRQVAEGGSFGPSTRAVRRRQDTAVRVFQGIRGELPTVTSIHAPAATQVLRIGPGEFDEALRNPAEGVVAWAAAVRRVRDRVNSRQLREWKGTLLAWGVRPTKQAFRWLRGRLPQQPLVMRVAGGECSGPRACFGGCHAPLDQRDG